MRRAMLLVLMCMVFTTTVVSVNASAGEGKQRAYRGRLSDGYKILIDLVVRDGRPPGLSSVQFAVDMTCDDGTVESWGVGFGWGGQLPPLPSHALDVDIVSGAQAVHLHGKVQAVHGSGTLVFSAASLTADEQPQLCTSGELTWTVDRTVPPVDVPPPTEPLQVVRSTTGEGVRITMSRLR